MSGNPLVPCVTCLHLVWPHHVPGPVTINLLPPLPLTSKFLSSPLRSPSHPHSPRLAPSPSTSLSQASPSPLPSVSFWSLLGTLGQLSQASPNESVSEFCWSLLGNSLQLSWTKGWGQKGQKSLYLLSPLLGAVPPTHPGTDLHSSFHKEVPRAKKRQDRGIHRKDHNTGEHRS